MEPKDPGRTSTELIKLVAKITTRAAQRKLTRSPKQGRTSYVAADVVYIPMVFDFSSCLHAEISFLPLSKEASRSLYIPRTSRRTMQGNHTHGEGRNAALRLTLIYIHSGARTAVAVTSWGQYCLASALP